ncbi:MAG: 2OG-Fe(II) oxygenase [Phenylobacterium sp.]|uniref:2OG-Fe(II) oxygenase family protein n=1 Tax=Phenylobacterium sp. TaxID=1871053 RepID=UPI003918BFAF
MLRPGQPAPIFSAGSPVNPEYRFSSLGGAFILLAFLPSDAAARAEARGWLERRRDLFDDKRLMAFGVLRDPEEIAAAKNERGLRWFFDPEGALSRLYFALDADGTERPHWVVCDPSLRIYAVAEIGRAEAIFSLLERLPDPDDHAGTPLHAPVLVVPRVFEPDLCRRLIGVYETHGGAPSGVMREVNGKTVGVLDRTKSRRDAMVEDGELRDLLRARLATRLLPEIRKAFQFQVTHIERYMVACYDAAEGGFFSPHRDNTTSATAHRKFACSINLNAEAFEGGDLRFPEFGRRTYRAPTGGAVIFSCSLLHEATPVTRGRRYAFLPFFYDAAGAAIRDEYARRLAEAEATRAAAEIQAPEAQGAA